MECRTRVTWIRQPRTPDPTDVSDENWAFFASYITRTRGVAPQGQHALRERFNGPHCIARTGLQWHSMPHDLPPWQAVSQQTRRWIVAEVFTAIIAELWELIRLGESRSA